MLRAKDHLFLVEGFEGGFLVDPDSASHTYPLFTSDADAATDSVVYLPNGRGEDLSSKRSPTNLERATAPFAGRNRSLRQAINSLRTYKCVNILGIHGCGKTAFLKRVGYYFHMRNMYPGGIYYIDLTTDFGTVDSVASLRERVQQETNSTELVGNSLLLLDNCDQIIYKAAEKLLLWMRHALQ
jgi:hypothetical protein